MKLWAQASGDAPWASSGIGAPRRSAALPRRTNESGWSLLDTVIALALLATAILGIATVITSSLTLVAVNRETALAIEAGRKVVEQMSNAVSFPDVFAAYNTTPLDDPAGVICPGSEFTVTGLSTIHGQAGLATGRISFPSNPAVPGELREDIVDPDLGMPRDLNGDGAVDQNDHAADYSLLPVEVQVRWHGVAGFKVATFRTFLTRRKS
jgi:hypothetical protein